MLDVVLEAPICFSDSMINSVSILVVLDVVLEASVMCWIIPEVVGFNPCCAGCSSGRPVSDSIIRVFAGVSILVVLDVVLEVGLFRLSPVLLVQFQSLLCWM